MAKKLQRLDKSKVRRPRFSPELRLHAKSRQTSARVESVILAVNPKKGQRINKRRLREDIDWAGTRARLQDDLDDGRLWRKRAERLQQISDAAVRLTKLMSEGTGNWACQRLAARFEVGIGEKSASRSRDTAPSLEALRAGLVRLARQADRELSSKRTSSAAPWPTEMSATDWLVGVELPRIYKRWFNMEPGASRSSRDDHDFSNRAGGPFVRFVEAVLSDQGIISQRGTGYTRETIAREFTRIKAGRLRRAPLKLPPKPRLP
jgi:hypothetical protein